VEKTIFVLDLLFWRQNPDSFSSHALTVDEEQAIERSYFSLGFRQ
jgi:hypothetical protein